MRMGTIGRALVLATAVGGIVSVSVAQTTEKPRFEVSSIKPIESAGPVNNVGIYNIDTHRFIARSATPYALIKTAYGLTAGPCTFWECDLLTGGPSWARSEVFEIQALMPEGSQVYTLGQLRDGHASELQAMLRTLLGERFHLVLRREMKELPVYALRAAKDIPKLNRAADDEKPVLMVHNGGEIIGRKASMEDLAHTLELPGIIDRLIVDETHLPGYFDFNIQYAPGLNNADQSSGFPSIFTAIQEQLGLKLVPTKGPVEILVIDSIDRPTEN